MKEIVCALLVNPAGEVLLGLRAAHKRAYPGCWDVFGGHVEPGETLDRALARELREELGITPIRSLALGSALEPNPDVNGAARYHLYRIHAWTGEPSNLGDEHDEIGWFTPDDAVAKQPIVPGVRDLIAAQLLIRQAAAPSP